MPGIMNNLRVIWACAKKDMLVTFTERVFMVTQMIVPFSYFLVVIPIVLSTDRAPTAVVMRDNGPYAQQLYNAMSNAHSFRLFHSTAQDAQDQLVAGKIVAVVTIPADFDMHLHRKLPVQVQVRINNLNTDFTADIRRAVPLSITNFYARAFPNLVGVTMAEQDWYAQDTDYVPYIGVSILVLGLVIGGIVQSGTAWAREWELETVKELLLSPASRWSLILGKTLGAFLLALAPAGLVLVVLIGPLGTRPIHWAAMIGCMLLTLVIFCALGALLGTFVKQRRLITTLTLGSALPLFFVSGPLGPVTFSTKPVQVIAHLFPVYYAIVLEQWVFHNFQTNTLGAWNVVILGCFALCLTAAAIFVLRTRTVVH